MISPCDYIYVCDGRCSYNNNNILIATRAFKSLRARGDTIDLLFFFSIRPRVPHILLL